MRSASLLPRPCLHTRPEPLVQVATIQRVSYRHFFRITRDTMHQQHVLVAVVTTALTQPACLSMQYITRRQTRALMVRHRLLSADSVTPRRAGVSIRQRLTTVQAYLAPLAIPWWIARVAMTATFPLHWVSLAIILSQRITVATAIVRKHRHLPAALLTIQVL